MAEKNQTEDKKKSKVGLIVFMAVFFLGILFLIFQLLKPNRPNFQVKKGEKKETPAPYTTRKKARVRIQGRVRGSHAFSEKEKKLYQQYLDQAEELQKLGDNAKSLEEKEKQYLLAIKVLDKMKKKRPRFISSKRGIIEQIAESLTKLSTLRINLGDTRKALIKALGEPEKERDSIQFFPVGTVKELVYFDDAVMISLTEEQVFAIKVKSNFQGSFYGIRIGDSFEKIKALYHKGRKIEKEGTNFCFESEELQMKFLFVDADENVDAIKQLDKTIYEELTSKFSD